MTIWPKGLALFSGPLYFNRSEILIIRTSLYLRAMTGSGLAFFDLYDIPVNLKVDKNQIQKKFYALSRQFHPDNFSLSDQKEQETALHKSALINSAKKCLESAYLRLEYILKEKDIIQEEEKFQLPMDFLSDMMELNEEKMECMGSAEEMIQWKQKIERIANDLKSTVQVYFDSDDLNQMDIDWQALKTFYYKKKYLERMAD